MCTVQCSGNSSRVQCSSEDNGPSGRDLWSVPFEDTRNLHHDQESGWRAGAPGLTRTYSCPSAHPCRGPMLDKTQHDPWPVLSSPIFALLPMKPESEQGVQPSTHQACHRPAKGHCTRGFESPVRLEAEEPHHSTCNSSRSSGSGLHRPSTLPVSATGRVEASGRLHCCRQNPPSAGRQCGLEAELQSAIRY